MAPEEARTSIFDYGFTAAGGVMPVVAIDPVLVADGRLVPVIRILQEEGWARRPAGWHGAVVAEPARGNHRLTGPGQQKAERT